MRFSVSFLGAEVFALSLGSEPASEPDSPRYDPTSTTACQTETAYGNSSVVLCEAFGSHVNKGVSLP